MPMRPPAFRQIATSLRFGGVRADIAAASAPVHAQLGPTGSLNRLGASANVNHTAIWEDTGGEPSPRSNGSPD
jgi:hypothetical protein